jgi:hypothetical protein
MNRWDMAKALGLLSQRGKLFSGFDKSDTQRGKKAHRRGCLARFTICFPACADAGPSGMQGGCDVRTDQSKPRHG